jgi:type IV fimbrial biogenesis protein FimT
MRRQHAFTLVELVVVVALVAVVLTLAAPSFRDFILMQRLKSINASVVTDLQFARSEAASRGVPVTVFLYRPVSGSTMSCYTIYTDRSIFPWGKCDCTLATPCPNASTTEIKTVRVPSSDSVTLAPPAGEPQEFAYDPYTGRISIRPVDYGVQPLPPFHVDTYIDASRKVRTAVGMSGRPQVCLPSGSSVAGFVPCV